MDSKDIELLKLYGVVYTEPVSTSCACCTTTTTTQGLCCITRTCIQGLGMVVTNSEPWDYVDLCDIGYLEFECSENFQHPDSIGQVVQNLGQCQETTTTTTEVPSTTTTETPTTTTTIFTCPTGYNSCGSTGGIWIVDTDCLWSFISNDGCPSGCESFHITWPDLAVNDCVSNPQGTIQSGRCCTPTTTTTGT